MPLYYAQAICSIFGRKHALLLCPSNLRLFWAQTSPTTMPKQFAAFLDANKPHYYVHRIFSFFGRKYPCNLQLFARKHALLPCPCNLQHYYYAHAICSFFGRKYALILWPCNLQLFWTHRYAENTKILEK